jgi:hypothetical protein
MQDWPTIKCFKLNRDPALDDKEVAMLRNVLGSKPNQGLDSEARIMIRAGQDPFGGDDGEPVLAFGRTMESDPSPPAGGPARRQARG